MTGMTASEKALIIDKDAADKYVRQYERNLGVEKDATAQMLDSAIGKFYKFLEIPPAGNRFLDVISGAWSLLSTVVPLLGGVKMAENLFVLCVKAEELTTKMAPVMRAGQRIASHVDKISPAVGKTIDIAKTTTATYTTTKEAIAKMTDEYPDPTKAFGNLEIAKQIRIDFINTLYLRLAAINKADSALHREFANRMNGKRTNPDANLEVMAKRLLPMTTQLTGAEFDQIELALLYKLISLYLQKNVTFTRNVLIVYPLGKRVEDRPEDYEINSINSNQMAIFAGWFGSFSNRGKYFNPSFFKWPTESDEMFLRRIMVMLNCQVVDDVKRVNYGRHPGEV